MSRSSTTSAGTGMAMQIDPQENFSVARDGDASPINPPLGGGNCSAIFFGPSAFQEPNPASQQITDLPELSQADLDAALERMIETARLATLCTSDPEFQRAGAAAMARLIEQRSQEQIARMEAKLPGPWRS